MQRNVALRLGARYKPNGPRFTAPSGGMEQDIPSGANRKQKEMFCYGVRVDTAGSGRFRVSARMAGIPEPVAHEPVKPRVHLGGWFPGAPAQATIRATATNLRPGRRPLDSFSRRSSREDAALREVEEIMETTGVGQRTMDPFSGSRYGANLSAAGATRCDASLRTLGPCSRFPEISPNWPGGRPKDRVSARQGAPRADDRDEHGN